MLSTIETVEEMLTAWDRGDAVTTIEMGGLGPGYEQALQIAAVELVRSIKDNTHVRGIFRRSNEAKSSEEDNKTLQNILDSALTEIEKRFDLGLSGAQAGAAMNIATMFVRHGYRKAIDLAPEDRRILISKYWPSAEPVLMESA